MTTERRYSIDIVTSLKSSLKFKKLGLFQGESYFVWFRFISNIDTVVGVLSHDECRIHDFEAICDAFTLEELLWVAPIDLYRDRIGGAQHVENLAEEILAGIKNKTILIEDLM
jgi:hypothetical protein